MAYMLDTDVFIRAKNLHYGFDFCPAFWEWLIEANARGIALSIDKVGDELKAGNDDLAQWAADRNSGFFVPEDQQVAEAFTTVSRWAGAGHYEPAAVSIFLQRADYYLVAQALAGKHIVVSHEVPSPSTRKIKIPDACLALGIKRVSPYEMLRQEHARFVLGRSE